MLYELRMDEAMPGQKALLNKRYAEHTIGLFKKHGIDVLVIWNEEMGTTTHVTLILVFGSMADREAKWNAFQADPEWQKAREESEKDGFILARSHNRLLSLTSYSVVPKIDTAVQEMRIYEAVPGKLPALNERFANITDPLLNKYGIKAHAYWTEEVGTSDQLVYIRGYDSLDDRDKKVHAFHSDPEWLKVLESERQDPLVRRGRNTILLPTDYSPKS